MGRSKRPEVRELLESIPKYRLRIVERFDLRSALEAKHLLMEKRRERESKLRRQKLDEMILRVEPYYAALSKRIKRAIREGRSGVVVKIGSLKNSGGATCDEGDFCTLFDIKKMEGFRATLHLPDEFCSCHRMILGWS
jgi:hypothetical protein